MLAATMGLATMALATMALASMGCGSPRTSRDAGPRMDVGPRDTGDLSRLDAWLDPSIDAGLDPSLDAGVDPTATDARGPDANSDVGPVDALVLDARVVTSGDGGGGGSRRDGGPSDVGLDARVPTGACGIIWDRGDPVPAGCLPRCSAETGDLFPGCFGDATCEATLMVRDTTRVAQVWIWDDRDFSDLDCASCVGTQRFSCWHDRCPGQSEDWVDCLSTRGSEACERERLILERCLAPYDAAVTSCEEARVGGCFP